MSATTHTNQEDSIMKINTIIQHQQAYGRYLDAQAECPHWDYEYPEGMEYSCCKEMRTAQYALKTFKK